MEIFLYLSAGLFISLFFGTIREKRWELTALWSAMLFFVAVKSPFWASEDSVNLILLFLLIKAFHYHVLFFFEQQIERRRSLINAIPQALVLVLGFFITSYGVIILSLLFVIELFLVFRKLSDLFRKKGITWFGKTGSRINWLQFVLTIFLILFALQWIEASSFWEAITLSIFGGLSAWHFSKANSFLPIVSVEKYAKSSLETSEKALLLAALDKELSQGEYLLGPDASLNGLAKILSTNGHKLSQLLNESKGSTYFELMASHRVKVAKKYLSDPKYDHFKIEEIAYKVGYASKSSFNTVFKKIARSTPSDYRSHTVRFDKVERLLDKENTRYMGYADTFELLFKSNVMISNFFKVYFRTQLRNKVFSAFNLLGLVLGVCSILLISVYIKHELSYDEFHEDADDLYRVIWRSGNPQTRTPHPLAQAMNTDFTQVKSAVSISPVYGPGLTLQEFYVKNPETNIMSKEADIFLVDSTFFDVFDFKLIIGDKNKVLRGVGDLVISQEMAEKYFADQNPLGKSLELTEFGLRGEVVGVMENVPSNSHFHPQMLAAYVTLKSLQPDGGWWQWGDYGHFNYFKLAKGADPIALENAIPNWITNHVDLREEQITSMKIKEDFYQLQKVTDIHLQSDVRWELEPNSDVTYLYVLIAAIIFLVIIVSINFINLSTARAFERNKEVGIRRTLGAQKVAISFQFLFESLFTCALAFAIGLLLAISTFSYFMQLAGVTMPLANLLDGSVLMFGILMTLFIGFVSGIYPSLMIARVKPVQVLKGKFTSQKRGGNVRKTLMSIQFIVSSVMICSALILLNQIKFMEDKELGFDESQTLIVDLHDDQEVSKLSTIKSEFLKVPGVLAVGGISNVPGGQFDQNVVFLEEVPEEPVDCSELRVDFDALPLLGLDLLEGRWFDRSYAQDSSGNSFLLNRQAINNLNIDNPIGKKVIWNEEEAPRPGHIVGVIDDFNFQSLHASIKPIVINIDPDNLNYLLVKVDGQADFQAILESLRTVHHTFDDQFSFDYQFLDQLLFEQYEAERRALNIFNLFTVLALILAGFGLLGLAYLIITQRTREIGIRKVIGARSIDILVMENLSFLKVIGVALIIGLPIASYIMQHWLESFAYRISLTPTPFVITVLIVLAVAIGSVTLAVVRTVLRNPSDALRYE